MRLEKTDKGRHELRPGVRTLGQRERTLLLLLDGQKTVAELARLVQGDVTALAEQLLQTGHARVWQAPEPVAVVRKIRVPSPAPVPVPQPLAQAAPDNMTYAGADSFEGKRSLATTRMFLFDICERMFVRREPLRAEFFRESLRNARDRESMLAVARMMVSDVEQMAGHERADSISERIAMLLPPEPADALRA